MRRLLFSALLGVLLAVAMPVSADIIGTGSPQSQSLAPPDIIGTGAPESQSTAPPDIIGTGEPATENSSLWNAFWLVVSSL